MHWGSWNYTSTETTGVQEIATDYWSPESTQVTCSYSVAAVSKLNPICYYTVITIVHDRPSIITATPCRHCTLHSSIKTTLKPSHKRIRKGWTSNHAWLNFGTSTRRIISVTYNTLSNCATEQALFWRERELISQLFLLLSCECRLHLYFGNLDYYLSNLSVSMTCTYKGSL